MAMAHTELFRCVTAFRSGLRRHRLGLWFSRLRTAPQMQHGRFPRLTSRLARDVIPFRHRSMAARCSMWRVVQPPMGLIFRFMAATGRLRRSGMCARLITGRLRCKTWARSFTWRQTLLAMWFRSKARRAKAPNGSRVCRWAVCR